MACGQTSEEVSEEDQETPTSEYERRNRNQITTRSNNDDLDAQFINESNQILSLLDQQEINLDDYIPRTDIQK